MFGKIEWYDAKKGYGYIMGADDTKYMFNITNAKNDIYQKDDIVKFVPNNDNISYATKVEKTNELKKD